MAESLLINNLQEAKNDGLKCKYSIRPLTGGWKATNGIRNICIPRDPTRASVSKRTIPQPMTWGGRISVEEISQEISNILLNVNKDLKDLAAINFGKYKLEFNKPLIMGVLNVTPDSFSDGGKFDSIEKAIKHAKQMVEDGADIIDVGGESSRPGSCPVSEQEELKRVKPVIERLAKEINVPVSIDTYKPKVAEESIKAGANIMNDITGLRDKKMIEVAAKYKIPVVIMHMKGMPKDMQDNPQYDDVVTDIIRFLRERINEARNHGIKDVIIDPGIGFGKAVEHNLQIIKRLNEFKSLNCPILVGTSRKSFIGNITGLSVDERLEGTIASIAIAIMNGADIVRVHDIKECKRAVQIADAIRCA